MKLGGYSLGEVMWEEPTSTMYSATEAATGRFVLIRMPKADGRPRGAVDRSRRDYDLAQRLPPEIVVTPVALEPLEAGTALVLEDSGARPLQQVVAVRRLDLLEVLEIGAKLAMAVGQLHAKGIIHKNLTPHSVWYDQSGEEVRLTDFGLGGHIVEDGYEIPLAGHIEGLITHIAPEQTGRLVRVVDHRADHYSLGVLLYQLLTGRLPFSSTDPLQIVHAHLARMPVAPHEINPAIPLSVSGVVMKLLSKAPDERYQSAHGLRIDLLSCLEQFREKGRIDDFVLGASDSFETFRISHRLYGREVPRTILFEAFERTATGTSQLVLVTGAPGAGKSVLVNELQRTILEANGHFVSGKFDQYRNDVPYAGIVYALRALVGQILSLPDAELEAWREKLLNALGSRGQVLVDVIPALELITGPCPPVPQLPVEEDRNRFNYVFRDFTRALTDASYPLVVFLDDLQWVDAGSLELLRMLVTDPSMKHLLVVGAYRDQDVSPDGRLLTALDTMEADGVELQRIDLRPLEVHDVSDLIHDTLRCGEDRSLKLAETVYRKTEGNPFFVNQFLQFLYDENLLVFDPGDGSWGWDLARIESEGITDDVVDLMTTRISRLSEEGQRTLRLAAFLGNEFTLRMITTVCERPRADVYQQLLSARRDGLLVALADSGGEHDGDGTGDGVRFRFLHDRVQQAAYALTALAQRPAAHLRIGRLLRAAMSDAELELAPFEVVNNLNRGADLLTGSDERRQLAELNMRAARRAQGTIAYEAALTYLNTGLSLLGEDCWESDYELAHELYTRRLQVDFVTGSFDEADRTFAVLDGHITDPIDRAYVATQKIVIDTASERSDAAIDLGLRALRDLGVRVPASPNAVHVILELLKNRWLVGRRRPTDLVDLPELHDERLLAVQQIMKAITPAAYIVNPSLMALLAARMCNTSIRFGNGPASPQGYVLHGLVVGALAGDYQAGYDFGSAAVTLSRRFDDVGVQCNALYVFSGFLHTWVRPLAASLQGLEETYDLAVDAGHADYAMYAIVNGVMAHVAIGTQLDELWSVADRHQRFADESKNDFGIVVDLTKQWIGALQEESGASEGCAAAFGQSALAQEIAGSVNATRLVHFLLYQLRLAYHLGEFGTAAEAGERADALLDHIVGQIQCSEHYFYFGLSAAAMARARPEERSRWARVVRKSRRKFAKWAEKCPENFEDKKLLIDAELLALKNPESALGKYDDAIAAAARNGCPQNEGIGNELAGRQALALGRRTLANVYLQAAADAYARWGARAKIARLDAEFPALDLTAGAPPTRPVPDAWDSAGVGERMDLDTVLKTAQTISGEARLDRLLDRLLRLVLENAGAERGCVIVLRENQLLIEASGSVEDAAMTVLQGAAAEASRELCYPIVQYVARTKGDVLLDDAREDGRFMTTPYVVQQQPRSILCSPVLKQGELVGLLYLENNLTTGAFTPQRLRVLQLITSEVASAIENARLSENLQERSQELDIATSKVDILEKAKVELSKFVPQSVQRAIEENPESPELEKRDADVSVLFLDIAGYTRMCEELGTDAAHDTVQRYFSSYLVDVVDNGGEIAETAGDGLMILFQDPDPLANACGAALAALAIARKTRDLNAGAMSDSAAVVVNIGINSGKASLGATKFESEAGTRYTYTASGSTTNLAARVGAAATEGAIFVTAETASRIEGQFKVSDQGRRSLKNVAEPVRIFSLEGEKHA